MSPKHSTALVSLLLLCLAGPAAALGGSSPPNEPLVLAQADEDPMVRGSVGIDAGSREEGVDADVRIEFGGEEEAATPPAAASTDGGGISVVWVALGVGVLLIVLLVVLLSRGGGNTVRD